MKWKRRGRAILGDGSECVFNVYEAVVVWDETLLTIPVDEADAEPLVGMSLMEGYELKMQVFEGGRVELRKVNTVEQSRCTPSVQSFFAESEKLLAAGERGRYAEPISQFRLSVFSRDWASKNGWLRC